ncbi:MAG: glucose 1-dehydrogenase [Pseudomonadota bacterium]
MKSLDGKIALITGGGQGIGRATARQIAEDGAVVIIANRNEEAGRAVEQELAAAGHDVSFVRTDVTKEADVEDLLAFVSEKYGRLDIAFNNAGTMHAAAPVDQISEREFDHVFDVNVKGVWLCMKAEIPLMMKNGSGAIINTASVLGLTAVPNNAAYVASKHAVIGLTRAAALEYGSKGIRINALSPALTNTEMAKEGLLKGNTAEEEIAAKEAAMRAHPIGRIGEPEDMAAAVSWLASDASSFVIGQSINVDGGWTVQ